MESFFIKKTTLYRTFFNHAVFTASKFRKKGSILFFDTPFIVVVYYLQIVSITFIIQERACKI